MTKNDSLSALLPPYLSSSLNLSEISKMSGSHQRNMSNCLLSPLKLSPKLQLRKRPKMDTEDMSDIDYKISELLYGDQNPFRSVLLKKSTSIVREVPRTHLRLRRVKPIDFIHTSIPK